MRQIATKTSYSQCLCNQLLNKLLGFLFLPFLMWCFVSFSYYMLPQTIKYIITASTMKKDFRESSKINDIAIEYEHGIS